MSQDTLRHTVTERSHEGQMVRKPAKLIRILAVSDIPPKATCKWDHKPGVDPPRGCHVRLDQQRELVAWKAQKLLVGKVGLGTDWAPLIDWKCNIKDTDEDLLQRSECETVLHRLANEFGFRYVQVFAAPHEAMQVWDVIKDEDGKYHQNLWAADLHITVRFGFGPDHCSVHGHIFLAKDSDGILDLMPIGMRKHVFNNDARVVQLWHWVNKDSARIEGT